jgi:hypothetical protein
MDTEEQNFIKLLAPIKGLKPSKAPLLRMFGLDTNQGATKHNLSRSNMWWYAFSPIVAVMIIFLIKSAKPAELDTASDVMAMKQESEAIGRQVEFDLRAIEEDNISKLGL